MTLIKVGLLAVPKQLLMGRTNKQTKGTLLEINYHEHFVKHLVDNI
jgi:hypothetical protein